MNFDVITLSEEYVEQLQKNSIKFLDPEGKEIAIDKVLNPNPVAQQTSTSNVTETKDKVNDQKSNPTPKAVNKAPATGDLNGDILYFIFLLSSILSFSIVFVLKRKSTDNI